MSKFMSDILSLKWVENSSEIEDIPEHFLFTVEEFLAFNTSLEWFRDLHLNNIKATPALKKLNAEERHNYEFSKRMVFACDSVLFKIETCNSSEIKDILWFLNSSVEEEILTIYTSLKFFKHSCHTMVEATPALKKLNAEERDDYDFNKVMIVASDSVLCKFIASNSALCKFDKIFNEIYNNF